MIRVAGTTAFTLAVWRPRHGPSWEAEPEDLSFQSSLDTRYHPAARGRDAHVHSSAYRVNPLL